MRYFGDIHGDRYDHINKYVELTKGCDASIQVGDFGAGFTVEPLPVLDIKHRFIRGNHDDLRICQEHPNWIRDDTYEPETGTYFLGGGYSVDRDTRQLGVDWWDDEQLSYTELSDAIGHYIECKPKIVISHECPAEIAERFFRNSHGRPSNTSHALGAMLYAWAPDLWIFGHHHRSVREVVNGTKFICLAEMEFVDI